MRAASVGRAVEITRMALLQVKLHSPITICPRQVVHRDRRATAVGHPHTPTHPGTGPGGTHASPEMFPRGSGFPGPFRGPASFSWKVYGKCSSVARGFENYLASVCATASLRVIDREVTQCRPMPRPVEPTILYHFCDQSACLQCGSDLTTREFCCALITSETCCTLSRPHLPARPCPWPGPSSRRCRCRRSSQVWRRAFTSSSSLG